MNSFEKWQLLNGAVANMLLLGTFLVAAYIGFKQMEIARQQTQINQKLLDLEYELSLDVEYDQQKKLLILWNRANTTSTSEELDSGVPVRLKRPLLKFRLVANTRFSGNKITRN